MLDTRLCSWWLWNAAAATVLLLVQGVLDHDLEPAPHACKPFDLLLFQMVEGSDRQVMLSYSCDVNLHHCKAMLSRQLDLLMGL